MEPFVFDNNYDNVEQVRPYFDDFMAIYDTIEGVKHSDIFKGRIPGLCDSTDKHEDTGIYLLQTMARLEKLARKKDEFIAKGAFYLSKDGPRKFGKGTLAHFGFYVGGIGWSTLDVASVEIDERIGVKFKQPRQRNWRIQLNNCPSHYLFLPLSK